MPHPVGRHTGQRGVVAAVHVDFDQRLGAQRLAGLQKLLCAVEDLLQRLALIGQHGRPVLQRPQAPGAQS